MSENLEFRIISKEENLSDFEDKVCKDTIKALLDGEKGRFGNIKDLPNVEGPGLPDFKCSYEDTRLYQFQWKEIWSGYGYFIAFVEAEEVDKFLRENKDFVNDNGFDPLNHDEESDGIVIETEVYVYSQRGLPPKKGLISLLQSEAEIVLVTADGLLEKKF